LVTFRDKNPETFLGTMLDAVNGMYLVIFSVAIKMVHLGTKHGTLPPN